MCVHTSKFHIMVQGYRKPVIGHEVKQSVNSFPPRPNRSRRSLYGNLQLKDRPRALAKHPSDFLKEINISCFNPEVNNSVINLVRWSLILRI